VALTKEACAKYCLPFLIAHCIENSLNLKQFESFFALIREMLGRVEQEQRQRLLMLAGVTENKYCVKYVVFFL